MKLIDLNPNERNPRKISKKKQEMLKKSIEEFGDLSGFVYNIKRKKLVSGHQRQKILPEGSKIVVTHKFRKITKTGTVAEGYVDNNGEHIKYREVSWDKKKETAAMIAANNHSGEWDDQKLKPIIGELKDLKFDMELLGFELEELPEPTEEKEEEKPEESSSSKIVHTCPKCGTKFQAE